jgi:hypothetical protein
MDNLNSAIADLKTTIQVEGFDETLVAEIAGDYEINPTLLSRKFQEKFGFAPKDATFTILAAPADPMVSAREHAARVAEKYTGRDDAVFGKTFSKNGEQYIAVVRSTRGLIAVRVGSDNITTTFGRGRSAQLVAEHFNLIG